MRADEVDRLPPCDIDAERALVGSALVDGETIERVDVEAEDFFDARYAAVWRAALRLRGARAPVDLVTVARALSDAGQLELVGGVAELGRLVAETPTSLHAEHYAAIVKRTARQRALISAAADLAARAYADPDPDAVLADAMTAMLRIAERAPTRARSLAETLDVWLDGLLADEERAIGTGLPTLDRVLGGMRAGDLVVLAGRPGAGKTALALDIARRVALKGGAVLLYSLEMSADQLATRLVSADAGIDARSMYRYALDDETATLIMRSLERLCPLPISIDDSPAISPEDIAMRTRRARVATPLALVIVDYLQLIQHPQKKLSREQQIADITRSLKQLARNVQCPVLALSQLNREVERRAEPRPQLSDLRESGAIENDADIVMLLSRIDRHVTPEQWAKRSPDKPYPWGVVDVIVAKHRHGPVGEVQLLFLESISTFVALPAGDTGVPSAAWKGEPS